jgi:NADH dehydrogenase FAD-containing subunit
MHQFVIIGGGAGGLELATRLSNRFRRRSVGNDSRSDVQIVLIDKEPAHVWKPLLHEIAAGTIAFLSTSINYIDQALSHGFVFLQGALIGLKRAERRVIFSRSMMGHRLHVRHVSWSTARWYCVLVVLHRSMTLGAQRNIALLLIQSSKL